MFPGGAAALIPRLARAHASFVDVEPRLSALRTLRNVLGEEPPALPMPPALGAAIASWFDDAMRRGMSGSAAAAAASDDSEVEEWLGLLRSERWSDLLGTPPLPVGLVAHPPAVAMAR